MNDHLHILVAGRHPEIVPTVIRLLNQVEGWHPAGTVTNEEAINHMQTQPVDVLLLCSGLTGDDEQQLRDQLTATHPKAIAIQHYGGGSGLLTAEIYEAIKNSA